MKFETAVVSDIVLDTTSKYFTDAGGWNGVGTVVFKKVKGGTYRSTGFAKPYFPNFCNYPLRNELVYIFSLPSSDIQENLERETYYYITPLNVWSSQHHNAIPNIIENKDIPESEQRDYLQTQTGANKNISDRPAPLDLGNYFIEQSNIKPLKKFEGDVIVESRVGSSLRFGTTVQRGGKPLSNWSTGSFNGQPITILRNGQGLQGQVGFLPTEENINNDNSSIYLTNGQQIPLEPSSVRDYYSYKKLPTPAKDYRGDQIVLNSGRLFFNSKTDSIFLSSPQSINLNSQKTLNVDTEEVSMQAEKILLGSKDAKEPVLYGELTEDVLLSIIALLEQIINSSSTATAAGVPIANLQALTLLKPQIVKLKDLAKNLKSETVYIE